VGRWDPVHTTQHIMSERGPRLEWAVQLYPYSLKPASNTRFQLSCQGRLLPCLLVGECTTAAWSRILL
jgi:hypothetical protein